MRKKKKHSMMKKRKEAIEIEMERNWANLLPEIFPLILKKLPDMCDFVRSRAVCKPWRFASSVSDLVPQFPWIIKLREGSDLAVYSITSNKVYTIRDPCSSGRRLCRPAGGYILTTQIGNDENLSLLNPLNKSQLPLPVIHDCDPDLFSNNITWFNPPGFRIDDYMLAYDYNLSVGCKPGDDKWHIIGPGHEGRYHCYYLKGLLFRVELETGVTKVMDISSCKELYVIPATKYKILPKMSYSGPYLVESCGEILSVCYNQADKGTDYKFYIYRLEFGNGKGNPCWVNLRSIEDRILFFDFLLTTGHGFCLRASDFAGFKGNCIYFINYEIRPGFCVNNVIYMFDIENSETVLIHSPFRQGSRITWFMSTLNRI